MDFLDSEALTCQNPFPFRWARVLSFSGGIISNVLIPKESNNPDDMPVCRE
jgi:hypothetical protein